MFKKTTLALALLASLSAGYAQAQTSQVQIYGVADAGYLYSSGNSGVPGTGNNTFSGVQSGLLKGSRLGFTGSEDLGQGLSAIFTLEYSVSMDRSSGLGGSGASARQQYVGLASTQFGTLALGQQYSPGYGAAFRNDPLGEAVFSGGTVLNKASGATIATTDNGRWNNAVTYSSPRYANFTAKSIYSFGESNKGGYNKASTADNSKYGLGLNYANEAINADLVYQDSRANTVLPNNGQSVSEWYAGGSYDFKVAKAFASYQSVSDHNTVNMDSRQWQLGVSAPVLAHGHASLSYARLDWRSPAAGSSYATTLAYTHDLSKRTALYAGWTYVDNDSNARVAADVVTGVGALGESNNTAVGGVRHSF